MSTAVDRNFGGITYKVLGKVRKEVKGGEDRIDVIHHIAEAVRAKLVSYIALKSERTPKETY